MRQYSTADAGNAGQRFQSSLFNSKEPIERKKANCQKKAVRRTVSLVSTCLGIRLVRLVTAAPSDANLPQGRRGRAPLFP